MGLSKIGLWWYSYLILLSFTFQAFVFCNSKHSQQLQVRLVSVSRRSLYIYSSWSFLMVSSQLGGVSMFSLVYSCPCVVLILCLITRWSSNPYMLASKLGKSISKGYNARGLCLSIISSILDPISFIKYRYNPRKKFVYFNKPPLIQGIVVIISGRLMGNFSLKTISSSKSLSIGRYGRILDLGYTSLCSIIGVSCIKVGIAW